MAWGERIFSCWGKILKPLPANVLHSLCSGDKVIELASSLLQGLKGSSLSSWLKTNHHTLQRRLEISTTKITSSLSLWKLYCYKRMSNLTFPFLTSSLASCTTLRTLEAMHRYLKNLWWADQNWPHIDFFIRCSASIRLAACWNFSLALTHCKFAK